MNDAIDIKGLDKVELLMALHANARVIGMGVLHDKSLTREDADLWIERCTRRTLEGAQIRFDYVNGRPIKVTFTNTELHDAWLYDRDHGEGACSRIVADLRAKLGVPAGT